MTTSTFLSEKNQEICSTKLVETTSENSIADFISSKVGEQDTKFARNKNDFINTFICHLIFYAVFCISLVLHILIDLGLGSLIKNQFLQLIEIAKNTVVVKNLSFA